MLKIKKAIKVDANDPVSTLVFKLLWTPLVRLHFKVYSVPYRRQPAVHANKGKNERIGQVFTMLGKNQINLSRCRPAILLPAKLQDTGTNDTKQNQIKPIPIKFPPCYHLCGSTKAG